jgi:hypothetical protein
MPFGLTFLAWLKNTFQILLRHYEKRFFDFSGNSTIAKNIREVPSSFKPMTVEILVREENWSATVHSRP